MARVVPAKPPTAAGILLGLGLGGFFDGIVLHQVLQWHHMVSSSHPPTTLGNLQLNTLWDGLFHVAAYAFTLAGLLLWPHLGRGRAWSYAFLAGALLTGWGLFNVGEGLINHHLLGIHHVREDVAVPDRLAWDIGFLAWGFAMIGLGRWLMRRESQAAGVGQE